MPIGNPMGYLKNAAQRGKRTASAVSGGKTGQKIMGSGAMSYAKRRPVKSAAMGAAGLGAAGYVTSGRRGRGADRVSGRPTGIRRY